MTRILSHILKAESYVTLLITTKRREQHPLTLTISGSTQGRSRFALRIIQFRDFKFNSTN